MIPSPPQQLLLQGGMEPWPPLVAVAGFHAAMEAAGATVPRTNQQDQIRGSMDGSGADKGKASS